MESISNPRPSISILIVEDDDLTREILAAMLGERLPEVPLYMAINGRTGLELFKTHTPNIVITDINMPEMGLNRALNSSSLPAAQEKQP
jgi:YesN/AraC family two-component response regulator